MAREQAGDILRELPSELVNTGAGTGDAGRAFYVQGLGMVGAAVGAAVALM